MVVATSRNITLAGEAFLNKEVFGDNMLFLHKSWVGNCVNARSARANIKDLRCSLIFDIGRFPGAWSLQR